MRSITLLLTLALLASACATTYTTQTFRKTDSDDPGELARQATLVFAFGKANIESATPTVQNDRTNDRGHIMSTGSVVSGMTTDEAIVEALLQIAVEFIRAYITPAPVTPTPPDPLPEWRP